jgi:hypothetical protein
MYDFHSLMNNEIIYLYTTKFGISDSFAKLTEDDLKKIDHLASLMQKPDDNFAELQDIYNNDKDFRLLTGGLI